MSFKPKWLRIYNSLVQYQVMAKEGSSQDRCWCRRWGPWEGWRKPCTHNWLQTLAVSQNLGINNIFLTYQVIAEKGCSQGRWWGHRESRGNPWPKIDPCHFPDFKHQKQLCFNYQVIAEERSSQCRCWGRGWGHWKRGRHPWTHTWLQTLAVSQNLGINNIFLTYQVIAKEGCSQGRCRSWWWGHWEGWRHPWPQTRPGGDVQPGPVVVVEGRWEQRLK